MQQTISKSSRASILVHHLQERLLLASLIPERRASAIEMFDGRGSAGWRKRRRQPRLQYRLRIPQRLTAPQRRRWLLSVCCWRVPFVGGSGGDWGRGTAPHSLWTAILCATAAAPRQFCEKSLGSQSTGKRVKRHRGEPGHTPGGAGTHTGHTRDTRDTRAHKPHNQVYRYKQRKSSQVSLLSTYLLPHSHSFLICYNWSTCSRLFRYLCVATN